MRLLHRVRLIRQKYGGLVVRRGGPAKAGSKQLLVPQTHPGRKNRDARTAE